MVEFFTNQVDALNYYLLLVLIVLLSFWESHSPRRKLGKPIRLRWVRNFALFIIGMGFVRLTVPILNIEAARFGLAENWGLLRAADLPLWLNLILGLLLLDLVRYGLHWAAHRYAPVWRLHRIHHTDREYDFTTSLRNHPFEVGVVAVPNLIMILLFGLHPLTVLLYEAVALAVNTFNHSNISLPLGVDHRLRLLLVTPDMHRVHHSSLPREFNANLGGLFPWWDRLFGTYVAQPREGHAEMTIGLRDYQEEQTGFLRVLLDPFVSSATEFRAETTEKVDVPHLRVLH